MSQGLKKVSELLANLSTEGPLEKLVESLESLDLLVQENGGGAEAEIIFEKTFDLLVSSKGVLQTDEKQRALRILVPTAHGILRRDPKSLPNDFFIRITQENDRPSDFYALHFYLAVRTLANGNNALTQWLISSGAGNLVLACCSTIADGELELQPSETVGLLVLRCVQALEIAASDCAFDPEVLAAFDLWSFALPLSKYTASSPSDTLKTYRQSMYDALANIIVPWTRVTGYDALSEDQFDSMKTVLAIISERIKSEIQQCEAGKMSADDLYTSMSSEVRFLRNLAYKSRGYARCVLDADVHSPILSILSSTTIKLPQDFTVLFYSLLKNLARKQVQYHATLVQIGLVDNLKDVLKRSASSPAVSYEALGCLLNLSSSTIGQNAMSDLEPMVLGIMESKAIENAAVAEMCFGILWCVSPKNLKGEANLTQWFNLVCKVLEKHGDHPACVRRGLGMIVHILLVQPYAKKSLSTKNQQLIESLRVKHSSNKFIEGDAMLVSTV